MIDNGAPYRSLRRLGTSVTEELFRSAGHSNTAAESLRSAIVDHGVVVINCATEISDEEQIEISASLGPLYRLEATPESAPRRLKRPEILDQSNLDARGQLFSDSDISLAHMRANAEWHTDISYWNPPAAFSLLSVRGTPASDSETEFADTAAAYAALPESLAGRLSGHSALHLYHGAEATHPLVHVRVGAASPSLYLASHIASISGLSPRDGAELLGTLIAHATRSEFTFLHKWTRGDVVIWDNRTTMHRGRPFDDRRVPRDVRRTTVLEEIRC